MRSDVTITTLLVLTLFAPVACNKKASDNQSGRSAESQAQMNARPADGVRRIGIPELQEALRRGEAVVLDVRGGVEYDLGHIKGALSMPLGLIAQRSNELPRDKLIVAYCA